ncbi:SDR family oxidoreductase [Cytophagaceae bacterium YF14B1]|uniref:SDR family oxidoreductase n=1 Tax=Xanthocytophaga flava TaxID=3048013 RepID=A0AAE3QLE0_9BACT|nr:SDR family oxidoreductase [Xanthocytophaga flavus]MDJ1479051.1 SDR family oxidoreductase [Xanthocytophaga flavus]
MNTFTNKVVWITGASSGIGEALVYALAQEGARLILSARRKTELDRVAQQTQLPAADILILPLDVEQSDTFDKATQTVIQTFGRIDVLILNAGISQRSFIKDTPLAVDRRIMEINYFGIVGLAKTVLPTFVKQQSGQFIVTSSVVGYIGTPMRSSYAASKHALHGFFDSLRAEHWKDKIKVTIVCPGYIKTAISLHAIDEKGEQYNKMDTNQEKGMQPAVCARHTLKAVKKNKEEVYIGGKEIFGIYMKRFFPLLLSRVIRNYNIKTTDS